MSGKESMNKRRVEDNEDHTVGNKKRGKKGSQNLPERIKVEKGPSKSQGPLAAFNSRCSPSKLQKICSNLTPEQKECVTEMGFGGLLEVHVKSMDRLLTLEIIKGFDEDDCCINLMGRTYQVSYHDVGKVFGLPHTGLEINDTLSTEDKTSLGVFNGISERQLEKILSEKKVDEWFKKAFILIVLSTFLCPTCNTKPSPEMLCCILDVENIRRYNISKFIFDWLVKSIKNYKEEETHKRSICGCVFFLEGILNPQADPIERMMKGFTSRAFKEEDFRELMENQMRVNIKFGSKLHAARKKQCNVEEDVDLGDEDVKIDEGVESLQEEQGTSEANNTTCADKVEIFVDDHIHLDEEPSEGSDGGLVSEAEVDPVVDIAPLRVTYPSKFENKLFNYCIRKANVGATTQLSVDDMIVDISNDFLIRGDSCTMAPRSWVNNMVIAFSATYVNHIEKRKINPSRYCLSPHLFISMIEDVKRFNQGHLDPWKELDMQWGLVDVSFMKKCKWVFAPVLYDNHWWCYAFEMERRILYVLDSLGIHKDGEFAPVDCIMAIRMKEILTRLDPNVNVNDIDIKITDVELPKQPTCDDCGVFVIKYMELWDDTCIMPSWNINDCTALRKELLKWVLDVDNKVRDQVIKVAGVAELLPRDHAPAPTAHNTPQSTIADRVKKTENQRKRKPSSYVVTPFTRKYKRKGKKSTST